MKRENIITISDSGQVYIPATVKMQEYQVAELFGVQYRTLRREAKAVVESMPCNSSMLQGGDVYGNIILPQYYNLELITAIAFRVQTPNAKIFREYILRKLTTPTAQPMFIQINGYSRENQIFN